jgi:hypothetical protein
MRLRVRRDRPVRGIRTRPKAWGWGIATMTALPGGDGDQQGENDERPTLFMRTSPSKAARMTTNALQVGG